jgi:hypothetical protein
MTLCRKTSTSSWRVQLKQRPKLLAAERVGGEDEAVLVEVACLKVCAPFGVGQRLIDDVRRIHRANELAGLARQIDRGLLWIPAIVVEPASRRPPPKEVPLLRVRIHRRDQAVIEQRREAPEFGEQAASARIAARDRRLDVGDDDALTRAAEPDVGNGHGARQHLRALTL